MRTMTANYTAYNANIYKSPVYIVEFGAITTKFVSGTFNNIGSYTTNKWVSSIRAAYGNIDIHEPDLTASTFDVVIADKSAGFTSFMSSNSLWGIVLTIKIGFQELDYADFVTLTPNNTVVIDIRLNSNLTSWTIRARDNLFNLVGARFNNIGYPPFFSKVNGALSDVETTTINIDDATTYGNQSQLTNNADSKVFVCVKIDNEIIQYSTAGIGTLGTLTRGMGSTVAAAHSDDAVVKRGLGFKCDPLRTMLHLLTSSFAGTNGKYDLSAINYGLVRKQGAFAHVDDDNINIENIERLGWRMFHEIEYATNGYFYIFADDEDDVMDLVQEKILKPHGLYFIVTGSKIDVGYNDYVYFFENFLASDTLTDGNIKRVSGIEHAGYDQVYNSFSFNYDYDHATDEFASASEQTHNSTASTYYEDNRMTVNHIGAESGTDTDLIKHLVRHRFLGFADISTFVTADCLHSKILLEPGDTPSITFLNLANIDSGARGWSAVKARLLGQSLAGGPDESLVENELRVFTIPGYVENALSGYYSINKVAEGSITDKALSVSTDLTATTEAADAYYDNSGSAYQADRIIFFIRITPPGFGGGSTFETVDLQISWLDVTPAIQNSDRRRYINFNPQSSTAFTLALDLYGKSSMADTPNRVKVDWNATTAAGGEIPTVEFVGVWFVKLNLAS